MAAPGPGACPSDRSSARVELLVASPLHAVPLLPQERPRGADRSRRRVLAGAAVTMATVFFVSRSEVLAEPGERCPALTQHRLRDRRGAVTWSLRPHSRLGPVLVALGFLYAVASPCRPPTRFYNLGRLVLPVSTLALLYASLSFRRAARKAPRTAARDGRRRGGDDRGVDGRGAGPRRDFRLQRVLSDCEAACPANPFNVDMTGTTFGHVRRAGGVGPGGRRGCSYTACALRRRSSSADAQR